MARRGAKLGTSVLDLDVDDSKFTSGLDRNRRTAQAWTDNLGRDVRRGIGQGIGIAGALGVAGAVSAAIGGVQQVVAGSIAAAMEWESAFAGVRKTVDASPAEFAELEGSIREMSTELPIASTELAGLAEAAGALGVAKKDILEFTRITAMIGTTTDVSSDQAATSLGQLSNVLGLAGDDYERFGSTLVDLGNKGASTESQILEIASRAGAGSKLIGMANDETLAWASSVANLGIEVEAGGSALQKFFLDSAKAVSEGSDKLETYARVAGMSGAAFKKAFEEDASGALQVFLAGLGELTQGEQLQILEDLDFNDVRITRTLLGLGNNVEMVADSLDVASEAWQDNTALAAEAEKRYGTTASKMQVLGNRVNDLAISFGEELLPSLATLATVGVEQLEMFATEVGALATEVGAATQIISSHFGEQGDAVNALADRMEVDFGVINGAIHAYQMETGADFDKALAAVETYGTRNTAALEAAGQTWALYQEQISVSTSGAVASVEAGAEGSEAALLAGAEGIGTAADAAFDPISKEAAEARDAAVKAMADMLTGISGMFETDETLRDSWQALIDRMDDPYTEAERKADIFSQNTINAIQGAIASGDPDIQADTVTLVNNMLTQFGLMEPGVLAIGEGVPPAFQEGMDTQMSALIAWIETNVTHEALVAMTLDEAKDLGLAGIWEYAQGMRERKEEARRAAAAVSAAARTALMIDTYASGRAFISEWVRGVDDHGYTGAEAVRRAMGGVRAQIPFSEPKDPKSPLRGITHWNPLEPIYANMAASAGEAAAAARAGLAGIESAVAMPGITMPHLPGLDGIGAHAAGIGGAGALGAMPQTVEYHMHYGGRELAFDSREAFMDELEGIARFNDGGVG